MKKIVVCGVCLFVLVLTFVFVGRQNKELVTNNISGRIIAKNEKNLTIQDQENIIYTFEDESVNANVGDTVILNYTGVLNKDTELQQNKIVDYQVAATSTLSFDENDLFGAFHVKANNKLQSLSLDEKIGQLFLARYDDAKVQEMLSKYNVSGFVFYEKDFKDKTEEQVKNMINDAQKNAKIPLLTAVDEEGGKIIRVSSNANLVNKPFKSSSQLYNEGGYSLIRQDTIAKSGILKNLGLNLNLAPVVDVVTNPSAYMYERSFKQDTKKTAEYAKTVIEASKNTGVSYTLKHFPGYGNNTDTHVGASSDTRNYEDILQNDLPPFQAGIESKAEAVLVSHNTVASIDTKNPASLSKSVHNLLRNKLNFSGIILTDDLDMGATSSIDNRYVEAILAGNDLIITTDYAASINEVKAAINNKTISEESIDNAVLRVLAWKYYKGLITDEK